jgi:hypothetical protein
MSDSLFSLSSLAIVTPIVALATYAIVLNLDRIIQIFVPLGPNIASSNSLFQSFIDSQVRNMQQDRSSIWRNRGDALGESRLLGKSGGRPSRWRVFQFVLRSTFSQIWHALIGFVLFVPHTVMNWRRVRRQRIDERRLAPLANLEDMCVQIQVDVNVEKGEASMARSEAVGTRE